MDQELNIDHGKIILKRELLKPRLQTMISSHVLEVELWNAQNYEITS
jgi:hypothetical protein